MLQQRAQIRPHRRFAHNTGQNRHGIEADLHHCDKAARLLLHVQHIQRARVALFAQNLQFDFTRRGQRQLGARHKRAHGNQQQQNQNGFKNIHIKYKRVDNF